MRHDHQVAASVLGDQAVHGRADAGDDVGEALAGRRALIHADRPEGVGLVAQALGEDLVRQALPFAEVLLDQLRVGLERRLRVAGGEDRGGGRARARQRRDQPARRPRQPGREPPIRRRFLPQRQLAEADIAQ